jgi:hypothetical protein
MREPTYIFVTGMFRSGTTLVARMLNAHQQIAFASDPFAPVFKAFRNAAARANGIAIDLDAPLDDYYFYPQKQLLREAVESADPHLSLQGWPLETFRQRIAAGASRFSARICERLDLLDLSSFTAAIRSGLSCVKAAYGDAATQAVGFKEVWTGEFMPSILKEFPEARVIYLVRDPRAVCASKNVHAERYPWLFLVRQWRKLATIGWHLERHPDWSSRLLLLRYEDLIREPEEVVRGISDFLGLPFSPTLLDPSLFTDGSGETWVQNSSYFKNGRTYEQRSIDKWRDVLADSELQFVEAACYWEMRLFGYTVERFNPAAPDPAWFMSPPHVPKGDLAAWIKPFSHDRTDQVIADCALDFARHSVLLQRKACEPRHARALTLFPELYDHLIARDPTQLEYADRLSTGQSRPL